MSYILVTGGAGYIGSHTAVELINNGYQVVIVDNLVNSSYDAVARIEYIVGKPVPFVNADLRDTKALDKIFKEFPIQGVIHFAALKAVGESTKLPLEYYDNNINGTISLLNTMKSNHVKTIVFSSSATVYGDATRFENMIPIPEHCPNDPTNPYGKTKYMIEQILKDIHTADGTWRSAILRYFNPIGAHPSGLLGEDPLGIPNNLLPYLAQVANGRRDKLSIFGNDYDSHDGTPIRDYIHVVDLAKGHIAALNYLNKINAGEGLFREWNLGTGNGSTVFDVYHAFCRAVGRELPYEVVPRRAGDVLNLTANVKRATEELGWTAKLSIDDACKDLWKWSTENPYGFNIDNYSWEIFSDKITDYSNRLHIVKFTGFEVSLANRGAIIQNVVKNGQKLVCGFDDPKRYLEKSNPFFGTTVGRVANRIGGAKFSLNGKTYELPPNEGKNTLHGGFEGYDKQLFFGPVVKQLKGKDGKVTNTLEFKYIDNDGNNGFPGDVETIIKYTIDETSVGIEFAATHLKDSPAEATVINLTNHSYFNISGTPSTDGTIVKSITSKQLEVDEKLLPTGKFVQAHTDITKPTKIGKDCAFDYCFIVNEKGSGIDTRGDELVKVFEASHPNSKVKLEVSTTDPAFQFYTGIGIDTPGYEPRGGFCIENGRFVNAINHEEWKDQVIVKRGQTYGSKVKYSFPLLVD